MKFNPHKPPPIPGAVLETLMGVLNKYPNTYCKIGQLRIIFLLKKIHGIEICRSTLCAWVRWLRENQYLKTYQGTHKNRCGKIVYGVTRYYLLPRAYMWLNTLYKWGEKVCRHFRVRLSKQNVVQQGHNMFVPWFVRNVFTLSDELKGRASPILGPQGT